MNNYASRLNLKFNNVAAITEFTNMFVNRVFVEKRWTHLNVCEAYNVNESVTELANNPNGLFINRFNEGYYNDPDPTEYDYYGVRGYPLIDLFPEWKEKKALLEEAGLELMVDSPCVLVTNRKVAIHRDGMFPEPPGYTSRRCGINYLLFDNSKYETACWPEDNEGWNGSYKGIEHTTPLTTWTYDKDHMNMINTYLPHGSYVDPNVEEPPAYSPRAFITIGVYGTYENAREKLSKYVDIDW